LRRLEAERLLSVNRQDVGLAKKAARSEATGCCRT